MVHGLSIEVIAIACIDETKHGVADEVLAKFNKRWPEMQSEIAQATYLLEPLFVDKSKTDVECKVALWNLAKKVLQLEDAACAGRAAAATAPAA